MTEARQSTTGAVFVTLSPVQDATALRRMAAFLEQRAEQMEKTEQAGLAAGAAGDAQRLRNVASRLRLRADSI